MGCYVQHRGQPAVCWSFSRISLAWISEHNALQICGAGEQILKQGWPGRSMYFVHAGFVDLIIDGSVADTIYPGDMFGEVALLSLPSVIDLVQVGALCPNVVLGAFVGLCDHINCLAHSGGQCHAVSVMSGKTCFLVCMQPLPFIACCKQMCALASATLELLKLNGMHGFAQLSSSSLCVTW